MISIVRSTAWITLIAILLLTLIPPTLRPVSPVPHVLEHFAIFVLVGSAFALGYPRRIFYVVVMAPPCIAGLELLQLFSPGRHARFGDFLVNVIGVYAGVALVRLVARAGRAVGCFR